MKKISPIKKARLNQTSLNEKKIISVRMSPLLLEKIKLALERQGLTPRKRSYWISEALVLLGDEFNSLIHEDKALFIRQAQSITGEGKAVPITLSETASQRLKELRNFSDTHTQEIKDAQSRIIHLAITLALVKSGIRLA